MAKQYLPTDNYSYNNDFKIFLAGTIDQGNSFDWQSKLVSEINQYDITIFNPRRKEWDDSWEQSIENLEFVHQVTWELNHLAMSDLIIIYFAENSKSPVTLLELGLFKDKKMLVYCPEKFYRKGNVDIVCDMFDIPVFNDYDKFLNKLKIILKNK